MAKSKLNYTKTTVEKISVKGTLSDNMQEILYLDEDEIERSIKIADFLKVFKSKNIELSICEKSNEELDVSEI